MLIDDILLLSRVNRKFLDVEEFEMVDLIKDIETDLEVYIAERGAKIQCNNLPKMQGHRVWIQQLYTNFINNAIKFNNSPVPEIEIGCEEHYDFYQFHIRDNGIGIEEKDYNKIFNLFQRLHTEEDYPGTGAGLTICKKIVESYGGKIWVESKVGVGTTFYFTLPKNGLEVDDSESPLIVDEKTQLIENLDKAM